MICAVRLMFEAHTDEEKGRRSIGGISRAGSVTILGAPIFMVGGSGQRRAASTKCLPRRWAMSSAPRHQGTIKGNIRPLLSPESKFAELFCVGEGRRSTTL